MPTSGCCCGADCAVYQDDFSADNIAADYTEVSGTWSVSGGIVTPSASGAILICDTDAASGKNYYASAIVKVGATASKARIYGDYVDSSNYHFVEFTINTTNVSIEIFKRTSGTNTSLAVVNKSFGTWQFTDEILIQFCWSSSTLRGSAWAQVPTGGLQQVASHSKQTGVSLHNGLKAGIGAQTIATSQVFDDFYFGYQSGVDNDYECSNCVIPCWPTCDEQFPIPERAFIDFGSPGITDGLCNACDTITGAYEVVRRSNSCSELILASFDLCTFTVTGGCSALYRMSLSAFPFANVSGPTYNRGWQVLISITPYVQDPSCGYPLFYSQYYSTSTTTDVLNCTMFESPYTLTADTTPVITGNVGGNLVCNGTLPSSITLYL